MYSNGYHSNKNNSQYIRRIRFNVSSKELIEHRGKYGDASFVRFVDDFIFSKLFSFPLPYYLGGY